MAKQWTTEDLARRLSYLEDQLKAETRLSKKAREHICVSYARAWFKGDIYAPTIEGTIEG